MITADVTEVLKELGIKHFVDQINPTYTVHLEDGSLIDSDDASTWRVITLDRKFDKIVLTQAELKAELASNGVIEA